MFWILAVWSVLRWAGSAVIVWIAKFLAIMVAPVAMAPVFITRTGGREHVHWFWQWTTTHDTDAAAWWRGSYGQGGWLKARFTQADYERSALLRWACRILWVWRNPAYQVAHWLGYDQRGMRQLYVRDEGHLWDSGFGNFSFWLAVNGSRQVGWMIQWQYYWWGQHCLEVYLGWKLFRKDPDKRCMVAARISPFRRYEI